MTKIAINTAHGGFGLSRTAFHRLRDMGHPVALKETDIGDFYPDGSGPRTSLFGMDGFCRTIDRDDPMLIQIVEEMGRAASGSLAHIEVLEIPDDVQWQIEEYDGLEWIAEQHRTWGLD